MPQVRQAHECALTASWMALNSESVFGVTHDVLFQVEDGSPPLYDLVAVVDHPASVSVVEEWLAFAGMQVNPALGVLAAAPGALTKDKLTLDYVETSYSADLSEITWKKTEPRRAVPG